MPRKKATRFPVNDRELPFRLSAQAAGTQKAYSNFISQYGVSEGRRIFLQKAADLGTGRTLRQKVHSTFKTGAKQGKDGKFS